MKSYQHPCTCLLCKSSTLSLMLVISLLAASSLFACSADAPDDGNQSADAAEHPDLSVSKDALVIAGFPAQIITHARQTSTPGGVFASSSLLMSANGGVVWGTQGYIAASTDGIVMSAHSARPTCTVVSSGGWNCGGDIYKCPAIDLLATPYPDFYLMSGGAWTAWNTNGNGPQSWYQAAGSAPGLMYQQPIAGSAGNWTLKCSYYTGSTNSAAFGHY